MASPSACSLSTFVYLYGFLFILWTSDGVEALLAFLVLVSSLAFLIMDLIDPFSQYESSEKSDDETGPVSDVKIEGEDVVGESESPVPLSDLERGDETGPVLDARIEGAEVIWESESPLPISDSERGDETGPVLDVRIEGEEVFGESGSPVPFSVLDSGDETGPVSDVRIEGEELDVESESHESQSQCECGGHLEEAEEGLVRTFRFNTCFCKYSIDDLSYWNSTEAGTEEETGEVSGEEVQRDDASYCEATEAEAEDEAVEVLEGEEQIEYLHQISSGDQTDDFPRANLDIHIEDLLPDDLYVSDYEMDEESEGEEQRGETGEIAEGEERTPRDESPHVTLPANLIDEYEFEWECEENDDWEREWEWVPTEERTELEKAFNEAKKFVHSNYTSPQIVAQRSEFYGLSQVASEGRCYLTRPILLFNATAVANWNAWVKLGDMERETAMEKYIELLSRAVPDWKWKLMMTSSS